MITKTIQTLNSDSFLSVSNNIEIAKGKYALSLISKVDKYKRYIAYKIWQVL